MMARYGALQQCGKRRRQRFVKRDPGAGDRMDEGQMGGMQRKAPGQRIQLGAIEIIARDRTADMSQMDTDLMGSTGFKAQTDERTQAIVMLYAIVGYGALAVLADSALRAGAKAGNRRIDCAFAYFRNAFCDGEILTDEASGMELCGQQALSMRMARNAQKTAGSLVKAIHGMVDECGRVGVEHGDNLLAQRTGSDMAGRQRGQRRAFGDDQQVFILIADERRR